MAHLAVYCLLIVSASLLGGWLSSRMTLTHKRMQVIMSAVGGLMLGIALFHMLPHALTELGPMHAEFVTGWVMAGLLTMFFLLRAFHFHHHDTAELAPGGHEHEHVDGHTHDHDSDAGHQPEHHAAAERSGHVHELHDHQPHELSWLGVFLGLGLHTLIDGVALAASVQSDLVNANGNPWQFAGAATFLAILVHKPLDAVSITSLMTARHWTVSAKLVVSAAFALMCPLGAMLFMLGLGRFSGDEQLVLGGALAFSAGVFLCISLSDLLPEMEFHSHHRLLLSSELLGGIAVAWLLHQLEPDHRHASPPTPGNPDATAIANPAKHPLA
ncbi:MAG: ZIP family metal transporter [Planctomycetaceae bacterium]